MMRPQHHDTAELGPADSGPGAVAPTSIADRQLRVVPADPPSGASGLGPDQILERVNRHIRVASVLGLDPLTIDERAAAMLDAACEGWRFDRRCRDDGVMLDTPHPVCLRAQYHHDVLLLEHGVQHHEGLAHEQ